MNPCQSGRWCSQAQRSIEQHLVDLAGHRGLRHAVAAEEANHAADLGQADPLEIVGTPRASAGSA